MAKGYGGKTTYQISPHAVEFLLANNQESSKPEAKKQLKECKSHGQLLGLWKTYLEKGLLTGKPFSPRTVDDYYDYMERYFKKHSLLSVEAVKAELMRIPPRQISKRQHLYKAALCFGKFLIREGYLDSSFIDSLKPLSPKRHLPPKRQTITEAELKKLLLACDTPLDLLLVFLLASTGLRASEACALTVGDVNLEANALTVRLGKGNKTRKVGLNETLSYLLKEYLATLIYSSRHLFLSTKGNSMTRNGLYQRLERVGKQVGVAVSPHALRRAFVTLNANKGRSLIMLQIACGHSDIKTTRSYCMTQEQEVIEAMKEW